MYSIGWKYSAKYLGKRGKDTQDKLYLSEGYNYVIISKKEKNTLILEKSRHYMNNHLGNRSFELNIA